MAAKIFLVLLRGFQWIPVIFINAVIVWSYYAYVFVLCYENVKSDAEKITYLFLYHPFFLLLMVSYWRTIMTNSDGVPREFVLTILERQQMDSEDNPQEMLHDKCKKLPVYTKTLSGGVRFCDVCQAVKPDRCHHCSMCRNCILKMDHHCPWVNNCVGFKNYKFFILFLFYAILYTMYITATVTKYFIAFWNNTLEGDGKLHILFLFFVALMFSISLWSLFGYHVWLTSKNRSTLESFRVPHFHHGPDKEGFNLGSATKNAEQVLGNNKLLWLLPIYTSLGDGVRFPLHNISAEQDSLLNERQRWMEEGELEESEPSEEHKQDSSTEVSVLSQGELKHECETEQPSTVTITNTKPSDVVTVQVSPSTDGSTL